ncbi:hypothetical protein [Pontibacter rugosus]
MHKYKMEAVDLNASAASILYFPASAASKPNLRLTRAYMFLIAKNPLPLQSDF